MEEPTNPGGGGSHGGGVHGGWSGVSSAGVVHGGDAGSGVEDLEELWPSRPSNAAAMLAQIWVDNLASSERFTLGLGGIDLDLEIWELRIHLDGVDNLERKLGRDDITVMNLYALIETQGFSFSDSIYCRQGEGMVIIQNNDQIYELLQQYESTQVLNLSVKRGRPKNHVVYDPVDANADEGIAGSQSASCIINYADPVVYDLTPPPVYAVDGEGTVFASQNSYFATQESRNDAANGIPDLNEANNVDMDFDMGVADFNMMEEMRRNEQAKIVERIEEMRQERMDPLLHCEGDTDIEDLFVTEEVEAAACIKEKCPFYIVASEIKGEKTFCIRKMQLIHTCDTTADTTRVSARWLARNYEAAFRSDPNASIQTLIDSARQQHGVEVPRMMAYMAKNGS
ncbi:hypothetical protein ACQ4PT_000073 [Festuca glaucescens]